MAAPARAGAGEQGGVRLDDLGVRGDESPVFELGSGEHIECCSWESSCGTRRAKNSPLSTKTCFPRDLVAAHRRRPGGCTSRSTRRGNPTGRSAPTRQAASKSLPRRPTRPRGRLGPPSRERTTWRRSTVSKAPGVVGSARAGVCPTPPGERGFVRWPLGSPGPSSHSIPILSLRPAVSSTRQRLSRSGPARECSPRSSEDRHAIPPRSSASEWMRRSPKGASHDRGWAQRSPSSRGRTLGDGAAPRSRRGWPALFAHSARAPGREGKWGTPSSGRGTLVPSVRARAGSRHRRPLPLPPVFRPPCPHGARHRPPRRRPRPGGRPPTRRSRR
jgi:hypothetical protein